MKVADILFLKTWVRNVFLSEFCLRFSRQHHLLILVGSSICISICICISLPWFLILELPGLLITTKRPFISASLLSYSKGLGSWQPELAALFLASFPWSSFFFSSLLHLLLVCPFFSFVWYFTIHFGCLTLLSVATSNVLFGYHTFLLQCLKLKLFILGRLWQSMMAIHMYIKGLKTFLALFLHVQAAQKEQIGCNWRRRPWFWLDIWGFIQIRFNIVLIRTHNIEQHWRS